MLGELLASCTFPPPGHSAQCALSGGPDSSALVALAVAADLDVCAVHVHHGLRDSADRDADVASTIARQLGVPFSVERADIADGPNLEARARAARHAAVGEHAMFGHTADDQAETVLLALLRGSGSTGLAGIRPGPTHPILSLRRAHTHAVCAELSLEPATDPTNTDPRFRRNRVRNELIPLLDELADRDLTPLVTRSAALLRDDDDFLDARAQELDVNDAIALSAAPVPLARRAVRNWLTRDGYPPSSAAVARVLEVAAGASTACEVAGVGRVQRSGQRLSVSPPSSAAGTGEPSSRGE